MGVLELEVVPLAEFEEFIGQMRAAGVPEEGLRNLIVMNQSSLESDRSVVVLLGAYLDENLTDLIKCSLINDDEIMNDLFKPGRVLGEFAAKNKLALLMGLYDQFLYNEMKAVASIRNDFAHNVEFYSFSHPTATGKITSLRLLRTAASRGEDVVVTSPALGELLRFGSSAGPETLSNHGYVFRLTTNLIIAALQSAKTKVRRPGERQYPSGLWPTA